MAGDVCMPPAGSQCRPRKGNSYDFDPTTSSKKSGKTPVK
jgi:hypothetical protein